LSVASFDDGGVVVGEDVLSLKRAPPGVSGGALMVML
jgi:hypothetical protein